MEAEETQDSPQAMSSLPGEEQGTHPLPSPTLALPSTTMTSMPQSSKRAWQEDQCENTMATTGAVSEVSPAPDPPKVVECSNVHPLLGDVTMANNNNSMMSDADTLMVSFLNEMFYETGIDPEDILLSINNTNNPGLLPPVVRLPSVP